MFLRYNAESRNAFHRAFNKLEKTLKSDAASELSLDAEAINKLEPRAGSDNQMQEAPDEPISQARTDVEPEMPIEDNLRDELNVEGKPGSPNEVNFDATVSIAHYGNVAKSKPVVIGVLLILLLSSARFASTTTYPNEAKPGREGLAINEFSTTLSNGIGREMRSATNSDCVRQTNPFAIIRLDRRKVRH